MEVRLRRAGPVASLASAFIGLLITATSLYAQTPVPQPTATCLQSGRGYVQTTCVTDNINTATLLLNAKSSTPATSATPQFSTPSAQGSTKATAPAPPVCGYFALSPQELQSPGAWAGVLEANTGDIRPWRFWTADVSFYEAGVPDSMKSLGVQPYWYICDGHSKLVYGPAPASTVQSPSKTPRTTPVQTAQSAAAQLTATIVVPTLDVNINPDQAGITGLVSYFWLTGFDGKPIYKPADPSPLGTGWLRATPLYYQWSFGDGSGVTATGLGEAYPRISEIAHTYDVRSDKSPFATAQGLYHVSVTAFFQVAFQVSAPGQSLVPNGQWVDFATYGLPPLQANVARDYKVREVRQVLTG